MSKKINPRHREFVKQYFICNRNASEAYRRVYPKCKNPNVDSAKLLAKASIWELIQKQEKEVEEKLDVTLEKIVREYAAIAFGNIGMVANWDGENMFAIPKDEITPDGMKFLDSIEKITLGKDCEKVVVKTLAKEKVKALDSLVKLLGYDKREDQTAITSKNALLKAMEELEREAREK